MICMASDWLKIRQTQLKATRRHSRQIQVYLAIFKAQTRYDVRLANGRAPGVCFLLFLACTCFWSKMYSMFLILDKNLKHTHNTQSCTKYQVCKTEETLKTHICKLSASYEIDHFGIQGTGAVLLLILLSGILRGVLGIFFSYYIPGKYVPGIEQ